MNECSYDETYRLEEVELAYVEVREEVVTGGQVDLERPVGVGGDDGLGSISVGDRVDRHEGVLPEQRTLLAEARLAEGTVDFGEVDVVRPGGEGLVGFVGGGSRIGR